MGARGVRRMGALSASVWAAARPVRILAVACLVAFASFGSSSHAQVQVKSTNLKCRNHIGSSVRAFVSTVLSLVDHCYAKPSSPLPCDQVNGLQPGPIPGAATGFSRAETFAAGITNAWCVQQTDIQIGRAHV